MNESLHRPILTGVATVTLALGCVAAWAGEPATATAATPPAPMRS